MNRKGEMYHKGLDAGKTPMLDIGKKQIPFLPTLRDFLG
jgi:hypothetical protein